MMELGVYSGCVVGETLEDKFRAVADIDYDFLELALRRDDLPAVREGWEEDLRELSARTGVPIKSLTWGGFPEFSTRRKNPARKDHVVEEVVTMVRFAAELGAGVILLPVWEGEGVSYEERLELYREGLRPCARAAEEAGVVLALEHIPASKFCNTAVALAEVAESVQSDSVKVYYDIGNDSVVGQDPVECIRKLGPAIAQVHLKGTRETRMADMPLEGVLQALKDIGFSGRGAIEVGGKQNNDHLVESLRVLREQGF